MLSRFPVWPFWDAQGEIVDGETAEIHEIIKNTAKLNIRGGLVIRPDRQGDVRTDWAGTAAQITLGSSGEPLRKEIDNLAQTLVSLMTSAGI